MSQIDAPAITTFSPATTDFRSYCPVLQLPVIQVARRLVCPNRGHEMLVIFDVYDARQHAEGLPRLGTIHQHDRPYHHHVYGRSPSSTT